MKDEAKEAYEEGRQDAMNANPVDIFFHSIGSAFEHLFPALMKSMRLTKKDGKIG